MDNQDVNLNQNQHQHQTSKISKFFDNKSIFITGGSGFVGKVLIEKLLRSCPNIHKIYILIRQKRNKSPQERLKGFLELQIFKQIKHLNLHEKLVLVEGEITQPNLGINDQDLKDILSDVSVVFHSAATVNFDEPLKLSIDINLKGTKSVVDLARNMPNLKSLVHISTAYANCDLPAIDEHIYPTKEDPEKILELASWMSQDLLQNLKSHLLAKRPNTYTYTKALSEWLLVEIARDLPVAICRPSIVLSSAKEPFPGWIDNVNGPTGIILGAMKGIIRSVPVTTKNIVDFVPVDTVVNMCITLAWFANEYHKTKQIKSCGIATPESSLSDYDSLISELNSKMDLETLNNTRSNATTTTTTTVTDTNILTSEPPIDDGYGSSTPDSSASLSTTTTTPNSNKNSTPITSSSLQQSLDPNNNNNEHILAIEDQDNVIKVRMQQFRQEQRQMLASKNLPQILADLPVFHCTTGKLNPLTWYKFQFYCLSMAVIYPSSSFLRYPTNVLIDNVYLHKFYHLFLHLITGILADLIIVFSGGKPFLKKLYSKFTKAVAILNFFVHNEWSFNQDNSVSLIEKFMSDKDREIFDCNVANIEWHKYLEQYIIGLRTYLLKESMDSVPRARKNANRVYYLNLSLKIIFGTLLSYSLYSIIIRPYITTITCA